MTKDKPMGLRNAHRPAYPSKFTYGDKDEFGAPVITERVCYGLSKREWFAGMALQGLIAAWGQHDVTDKEELAHDAAGLADAILSKLENK